ncbi:MAG: NAD-dependent epimerase/dehydratase family protein [Planctomycetota bacterium]|nr:MAG: NAD-dependent epimerase/dehydratase family protein [Planctomycetota bacterium]
MTKMNLVTGATGLLGSHIVEQLRRRDMPVRVLVRPGSDRSWLETQNVEFAEGDVTDADSVRRACEGCDVVYHSAARVGDWGPWEEFQAITIDGTRNMIDAAQAAGVRRFVHISSISTYGYHTKPIEVDESFELGYKMYKWAYYTRSKVEAERIVWDAHRRGGIELTVIRPSWIYGERDRTTIGRLYHMIKTGKAKILGPGDNRLNVVYAGNCAEAAITAAHLPAANGQAYNCSNDGSITQREYFDLWARTIGVPPLKHHAPYKAAYFVGFLLECWGHLTRSKKPPFITRYAVWLMGRRSYFSAEKARRELGWKPTVTYEEGVPRTVQWYLDQQRGGTQPQDAAGEPAAATA